MNVGKETKIINVDFTKVDIYDHIKNELKELDIGVLNNNAFVNSTLKTT